MAAFTLAEVLVATTLLAIAAVSLSQALLGSLRQASAVKTMNLAKAEAMARIQEVATVAYDPLATPPQQPSLLAIGTSTAALELGEPNAPVGSIPGTLRWTVSAVANPQGVAIRKVRCEIDYQFQRRNLHYEITTFRSPD